METNTSLQHMGAPCDGLQAQPHNSFVKSTTVCIKSNGLFCLNLGSSLIFSQYQVHGYSFERERQRNTNISKGHTYMVIMYDQKKKPTNFEKKRERIIQMGLQEKELPDLSPQAGPWGARPGLPELKSGVAFRCGQVWAGLPWRPHLQDSGQGLHLMDADIDSEHPLKGTQHVPCKEPTTPK